MTPLYADQLNNAATLEELGVGIYLDILTVTKEKILNSINAVINDTRWADNTNGSLSYSKSPKWKTV